MKTILKTNGEVLFHNEKMGSNSFKETVKEAIIIKINLQEADFRNQDLSYIDFDDCELSSADFRGANLEGCNLYDCELSSADFRGANLRNINMYSCWCDATDFRDSNFENSKISVCYLNGIFRGTNFKNCEINNLDFTTDLYELDFTNCNLNGAILDIEASKLILHGAFLHYTEIKFKNSEGDYDIKNTPKGIVHVKVDRSISETA